MLWSTTRCRWTLLPVETQRDVSTQEAMVLDDSCWGREVGRDARHGTNEEQESNEDSFAERSSKGEHQLIFPPFLFPFAMAVSSRRRMDHHRDKRTRGSLGRRLDGLVLGLWQGAKHALEPGQANGLRKGESKRFRIDESVLIRI